MQVLGRRRRPLNGVPEAGKFWLFRFRSVEYEALQRKGVRLGARGVFQAYGSMVLTVGTSRITPMSPGSEGPAH
jgi:hypothetical protein